MEELARLSTWLRDLRSPVVIMKWCNPFGADVIFQETYTRLSGDRKRIRINFAYGRLSRVSRSSPNSTLPMQNSRFLHQPETGRKQRASAMRKADASGIPVWSVSLGCGLESGRSTWLFSGDIPALRG